MSFAKQKIPGLDNSTPDISYFSSELNNTI